MVSGVRISSDSVAQRPGWVLPRKRNNNRKVSRYAAIVARLTLRWVNR